MALFVVSLARVMAHEVMPPPHSDFLPEPEGMLCMDNMETEPYSDELEPTPAADVDSGCSVSELPISV